MTTPTRSTEVIAVQAASAFPASDASGWTAYATVQAVQWSLGRGPIMGTAILEARWGSRSVPAGTPAAPSTIDPATVEIPVGYAVRLLKGSPASAIWWGIVTGHRPDPQRQITVIECVEARAVLSYVYCLHSAEINTGTGLALTGTVPPFNARAGGDRSVSEISGAYVWDRSVDGSGYRWSAADASGNLTTHVWEVPLPLTVPTAGLLVAWYGSVDRAIGELAVHGRSIADALNLIWPEDDGYSWRLYDVADGTMNLEAIELAGSGLAVDLDALAPWTRVQRIATETGYAVCHGSGGKSRLGLSLAWDAAGGACALEPYGWTPGTDANTAIDSAVTDQWDGPEWRKWVIAADWDGTRYGSASDGVRRVSAAAGTRAWPVDANDLPSGQSIVIDRNLPCGEGFTTAVDGQRQRPVIIAGDGTVYEDVSALGITIEEPGVLVIGSKPEDAQLLRDLIGTTGELIVTVGLIEPDPLERWSTVPGSWANGRPEVVHLDRPDLEQWTILAGTVTGIDPDDGSLVTLVSPVVPRDDQTTLNDLVDDAAARLTATQISAAWENLGAIDATYLPGDRITSIEAGGRTWSGQGVVARVTWRARLEEYGTTVEVEPVRGVSSRA